jgi:hypothetical protein
MAGQAPPPKGWTWLQTPAVCESCEAEVCKKRVSDCGLLLGFGGRRGRHTVSWLPTT